MTIDDLIEEFIRLEKKDPGARLDWNSTGEAHIIQVAAFASSRTSGCFRALLDDAGRLIPAEPGNPGSTPWQQFIVTVFHTVPELMEHDPRGRPSVVIATEQWADGRRTQVECWHRTIPNAAHACVMALRRLREAVPSNPKPEPEPKPKPLDLSAELQSDFELGLQCASLVLSNPAAWREAAEWLLTTPHCIKVMSTWDKDDIPADRSWCVELEHGSGPLLAYDNDEDYRRCFDPISRRLIQAVNILNHVEEHRRQYLHLGAMCDFGEQDARRVTLAAALLLNRDFDGKALPKVRRLPGVPAFPWPWEIKREAHSFNARSWAQNSVGLDHPMIRRALTYLAQMPAASAPAPRRRKRGAAIEPKLTDKQKTAIEYRDRRMSYQQIADAMGIRSCSAARRLCDVGYEKKKRIEAMIGGGGRSVGKTQALNEALIVDGPGGRSSRTRRRQG